MNEDDVLVGQLRYGDLSALASVYIKYKPRLIATACSYHIDIHQAEDIIQDVFLSLTHRINELDINQSLYGYLRTGIVNGIRDVVRKKLRQEKVMDYTGFKCASDNPHDNVIRSEQTDQAEIELSGLPHLQREVLNMRIFQGLKFNEIAQAQGVSSSTVRGRYRYGISRLQKHTA